MRLFLTAILAVTISVSYGQFPKTYSASELYHQLEKLNSGASILYLAAHPDDENTRLISYFENKLHVRTAYLSLTRGDGGQNLIGTEIGPGIGVLRTQELLGARAIDGGEQYFSRAVDFGYSKSAKETFEKWGKEEILADVVFVIRQFQPDVIVTRFPTSQYAGHGHHTASAVLAEEAFDLAADPNAFPEQLEYVDTWQPKRLYFNTSSWWVKDLEQQANKSNDFLRMDVGEFNNQLGTTYAQIASRARSEHKSQGFGTDFPYGTSIEYIRYVKGEKVSPGGSILEGIENDWARHGAPEIGSLITRALAEFDANNPAATASTLAEAGRLLNQKEQNPFFIKKQSELNDLLLHMVGVFVEFNTSKMLVVPGENVTARLNVVNPASTPINMEKMMFEGKQILGKTELLNNALFSEEVKLKIDKDAAFSNPYWLTEPYENLYVTEDYTLLGKPENDPSLSADLHFEIDGYRFVLPVAVKEKIVDPAKAVIFNPTYVVPHASFNFSENVVVSVGDQVQTVYVTATNHGESFSGNVRLSMPNGWKVNPAEHKVSLKGAGDAAMLGFEISPTAMAEAGNARVEVTHSDVALRKPAMSLQIIDYDHIPAQIILTEAEIGLVPIDLQTGDVKLVGYIDGPGDDVAKYLKAAGYLVEHITERQLRAGELDKYDAILTGIRAFNTRDDLAFFNDNLNTYVENGGTWIVQYNTSRGIKSDKIGPYPFVITNERVTDEYAEARILNPGHRVMHYPNEIGDSDFDDWVQERGLYFAADWDSKFEPIISWNDPDEPPRNGGLIIAPYGDGNFVYTGISFFRELPAGVPGAYRLLANLLALSQKAPKN